MGRPAGGVTGARFKREGDEVIDMIVVPNGENACCMLTACVNGYGKRTPLTDYPVKGRGTRGVISIDANDRNGEVRAAKEFTASAPVSGSGNRAYVDALNRAFGQAASDIVRWTDRTI